MRKSLLLIFVAILALSSGFCGAVEAKDQKNKVWTLDDRQEQLMKDINEGQKAKELTAKEANSLRSDLSDVSRKKVKFKKKNDGHKLTDDNKTSLEKDLNDISVKIKKLELEKRTAK